LSRFPCHKYNKISFETWHKSSNHFDTVHAGTKIPEIDLFESLGKNIHISFCLLFGSLYKYILLFSPIIFVNISLPCFQNGPTLFTWAERKTSFDRAKYMLFILHLQSLSLDVLHRSSINISSILPYHYWIYFVYCRPDLQLIACHVFQK